MKIHINPDNLPTIEYPVVTMGTFDGVHIGHQSIFNKLIEIAKEKQGETVVVTFEPHPRLVLKLDHQKLRFLSSIEEKQRLIQKSGIDHLVLLTFTEELSKMSSENFIKTILVDKIQTRSLVVGYDHHFGKDRKGDFNHLYGFGKEFGFAVEQVAALEIESDAVSSTKIRYALSVGEIEKANYYLAYNYSLSGKVIGGNRIGKTLGFPTANISVENKYKLIPANGVYAVYVKYKNKSQKGMVSIGSKPTFNDYTENIEVHIFDFDETIYGQQITINFLSRIRDIMKFDSADALKEQLVMDMRISKELL
ncbi:MAG: bifunctional riboflavin kinase/FAD synthetase [Bacteroidales bacterium]|nr:bifunctional riboflavin kinase/FAD synthetase [Bacteroidales bacterium]